MMSDSQSVELKEAVRVYLDAQVREHLVQRAEFVKDSDLRATIVRFKCGLSSARMTAQIEGTLNGTPIRIRRTAQRNSAYQTGAGAALGGAFGGFVAGALVAGVTAGAETAEDNKYVVGCAQDICSSFLIQVDRRLEVPRSAIEERWLRFRNLCWIAALVVEVALVIVMVQPNMGWGKDPPPLQSRLLTMTLIMLLPAGCFLIVVYCAAVLAMPSTFFETPHGRRVMATSGVRSTKGLRALCVIFIIGLTAGMSTLIWYLAKHST